LPLLFDRTTPLLSVLLSLLLTWDPTNGDSIEFKEIRKEWKARKKEEENQRKAAEERERQAAAQAQAQGGPVEGGAPTDPQGGQPPSYAGGVRPQLPPIGYQPAENQVPGQYAPGGAGGMVYPQGNGQMYGNYPHSPYAQSNQVYQQRK
jgi:hypothetical protein